MHWQDTLMIKHFHALAREYGDSVRFGFVDIIKDEDNIAFSLGIDTLHLAFLPVMIMVHGPSVYIAPKRHTETFKTIANWIEAKYKNETIGFWPLQRRLEGFPLTLKKTYRTVTNGLMALYGEDRFINPLY